MTRIEQRTLITILLSAAGLLPVAAASQTGATPGSLASTATIRTLPLEHHSAAVLPAAFVVSSAPQPLFDLSDSNVKFNIARLMSVLRDDTHEGWVLAAYPDPKTSRPLIGAGFSLDLDARPHPQSDPLNPHSFLEPSSAQLWQAAGLDSAKLDSILDEYDRDLDAWQKQQFRRKIRRQELSPQLTENEATQLLRISAIQAVYNARAYCRFFDQMTASQQIALSQLVFQMGINLEEFTQFRATINQDPGYSDPALQAQHWKDVQESLIHSDWARRYRARAVSVIAMFDPQYDNDPWLAERKVSAVLRPPARHRRRAAVRSAKAHRPRKATHKQSA